MNGITTRLLRFSSEEFGGSSVPSSLHAARCWIDLKRRVFFFFFFFWARGSDSGLERGQDQSVEHTL